MSTLVKTQLIQFNNNLCDLIHLLTTELPEHKRKWAKYYKYYRNFEPRIDFIEEFVGYLGKYMKDVSICDEGLFSDEVAYYGEKPIELMKSLDFKIYWRDPKMTDALKEKLWKSWQTLYIISDFILKENNRVSKILTKQKDMIANMLQTLKLESKIKAEAERRNAEEASKASEGGFNFDLKGMFGEDNVIMKLAMEIAQELKLSELGTTNPLEAIKTLFGQNGTQLQSIIDRVSQKVQDMIARGEINETTLMEEAKKMNTSLMGKFKGIPGMPNLDEFAQKLSSQITTAIEKQKTNPEASGPMNMSTLLGSFQESLKELGLDGNLEDLRSAMGFDSVDTMIKGLSTQAKADPPAPNPLDPALEDPSLDKELEALKQSK